MEKSSTIDVLFVKLSFYEVHGIFVNKIGSWFRLETLLTSLNYNYVKMAIDKQKLKTALSLIHKDGRGYFLSGRFVDLFFVAHVKNVHDVKFRKLNRYRKFI